MPPYSRPAPASSYAPSRTRPSGWALGDALPPNPGSTPDGEVQGPPTPTPSSGALSDLIAQRDALAARWPSYARYLGYTVAGLAETPTGHQTRFEVTSDPLRVAELRAQTPNTDYVNFGGSPPTYGFIVGRLGGAMVDGAWQFGAPDAPEISADLRQPVPGSPTYTADLSALAFSQQSRFALLRDMTTLTARIHDVRSAPAPTKRAAPTVTGTGDTSRMLARDDGATTGRVILRATGASVSLAVLRSADGRSTLFGPASEGALTASVPAGSYTVEVAATPMGSSTVNHYTGRVDVAAGGAVTVDLSSLTNATSSPAPTSKTGSAVQPDVHAPDSPNGVLVFDATPLGRYTSVVSATARNSATGAEISLPHDPVDPSTPPGSPVQSSYTTMLAPGQYVLTVVTRSYTDSPGPLQPTVAGASDVLTITAGGHVTVLPSQLLLVVSTPGQPGFPTDDNHGVAIPPVAPPTPAMAAQGYANYAPGALAMNARHPFLAAPTEPVLPYTATHTLPGITIPAGKVMVNVRRDDGMWPLIETPEYFQTLMFFRAYIGEK